jgi:ATP-dependent Clp protease ATP-binding subunit ClpB
VVLFKPLTREEIQEIVGLLVGEVQARLAERKVGLETTEAARAFLAAEGYDPVYGARPLRRFIQHEVETALARRVLEGTVADGSVVEIDVAEGVLTFRVEKGTPPPVDPAEVVAS